MLQQINTERMYTYEKMLASMFAVLMLLVAVPQMCFADDVDVSETTDGVDTYEYIEGPDGDIS